MGPLSDDTPATMALPATAARPVDVATKGPAVPPAPVALAVPATERASAVVRVTNLADTVGEADLRPLLSAFGPIASLIFRQTSGDGYGARRPRAGVRRPRRR